MLQNQSSSAESAHANAEASVSGHRLDSRGNSIDFVGRKRNFFDVREWMGLKMRLRNWNDFAAKTKFGIALENFCGIEVGLRIFLSEKKKEEKFDLESFCPKKRKRERELDLKKFVQVKGRKKKWIKSEEE